VFALVGEDTKGMVWNADMPAEIAAEVEGNRRVQVAGAAELVELDAFRGNRHDLRRSQVIPRRRSDRAPAWDRPSYLRVVK
jgi:hypothetical protein